MNETIVVAVDAMGGDNAPDEIIKGSVNALEYKNVQIILVGNQNIIDEKLKSYNYNKDRIKIVHATQVISTEESPTKAIKEKKDSSLVVGLNLVKQKEAMAFVSAGSTGAILTSSILAIDRMSGIERPALGTILPNKKGISFLMDVGANADIKPAYLVQFAKMGSVYMENVLNINNPKVGLINIGSEKEKGNLLTKEAYTLLENENINFIGNVEARDIPYGGVDVMVCDGFVGNIILKHSEGFSSALFEIIKQELMADSLSKVGAILSKKAFGRLKKKFDHEEVGGAAFLGLDALVVKAHGSSSHRAIKGAINQCINFIDSDVINKIKDKL